jgi:long-chain acyl-CoA synthetase
MNAIAELQERPWLKVYRELGVDPAGPVVEERSLADYIEEHARRLGTHPAMEYLGVTLTYAELDALANRLANVLRARGIGRGDVIGIHLPNTPQYLVTLVAAAKLGAAVSGVSPLLTPPEVAHQVNDAGIRLLVSLDQLYNSGIAPVAGQVPGLKTVIITGPLDFLPGWKRWLAHALKKLPRIVPQPMTGVAVLDFRSELAQSPATRIHTRLGFDDTLYIQYTGGTTGKPKGAELTLRSMFSNARQGEMFSPYDPGNDTLASAFPYFHMAGLSLALLGLQTGARLLVIPDPRNVTLFCRQMQKYPPSVLANVPTLYQMLAESPEFRKIDFSRLRVALSGAAPFPAELIHRLESVIGQGKVCEVYGMTESSPLLTMNPPGRAKVGSVGIPVPGTDLLIVDAETGDRIVAPGEPGEIIARGPQIMKGYLNLPEASRKTLREFNGKTWLYTGDVAKMDDEGYLTICDRSKDMLIVGGYKVFSVEVESKLAEIDFIELAAVIGQPDAKRPGNDIVTLYVQLKPQARGLVEEELRETILQFCRDNMAAYKIPKHVHFMEALPLTAVGKLDKKALRH